MSKGLGCDGWTLRLRDRGAMLLVRASAIEYTASEASLSEDFIMISRRQAFAVTILGLIGGSTVALAQTKKGSAPVRPVRYG